MERMYMWFLFFGMLIVGCTTPNMGEEGQDGEDGEDGATVVTGPQGPAGADGEDGESCTVTDNGDGTATITCGDDREIVDLGSCTIDADDDSATITCDGESFTVRDGEDGATGATGPAGDDGADGESCTIINNPDGSATIVCPDGTSYTFPTAGSDADADSDSDTDADTDSDSDADADCGAIVDGDYACGEDEDGDDAIMRCSNGDLIVWTSCPDGEECSVEDGVPNCVPTGDPCDTGEEPEPECVDDTRRCDGADLDVCEDREWVSYDCPSGQSCATSGGVIACVVDEPEPECQSDEYEVGGDCVECVYGDDSYPCKNGGYCASDGTCMSPTCRNYNSATLQPADPVCGSSEDCYVTGRKFVTEEGQQTGWRLDGICGPKVTASWTCWDVDADGSTSTTGGTCELLHGRWSPEWWSSNASTPYCQESTWLPMTECCSTPGSCQMTRVDLVGGGSIESRSIIRASRR